MEVGSPSTRDTVGLAFAVGGEPPASLAEICRTIDAAGLPAMPWRAFRRPTIFWDGPGGELDATDASLESRRSGARRLAGLMLRDGPLHLRTVTAAFATPEPIAPDPWQGLSLQPLLDRAGQGRIRQVGGSPSSTVTAESVAWRQGDQEWDQRVVVLAAEPADAGRMLADARALSAILPLRLLGERADRVAARRLSGDAPRSVKVASGSLDAAASAGDALLVIGRSALRQMLGNLELVADTPAPEAIHQFRVGLRRVRAALSLFKSCLDPEQRQALGRELKWANGIFADARDWDVFTAEMLAPMVEAVTNGGDLAHASEQAAEHRRTGYATVSRELFGARLTGAMLELVRWFEAAEAPLTGDRAGQPLKKFTRRALRRSRNRLVERYDSATPQTIEEWHALRILAKKLRYATDAFAPIYGRSATRPFQRALEDLQDCLGRYHDTAVAERLAHALGDTTAAAMVAGWAARERMEQHQKFHGAWKHFRKKAPFWQRD